MEQPKPRCGDLGLTAAPKSTMKMMISSLWFVSLSSQLPLLSLPSFIGSSKLLFTNWFSSSINCRNSKFRISREHLLFLRLIPSSYLSDLGVQSSLKHFQKSSEAPRSEQRISWSSNFEKYQLLWNSQKLNRYSLRINFWELLMPTANGKSPGGRQYAEIFKFI